MHHQCGVGRGGDTAGSEVDDRQATPLGGVVDQVDRRLVFAGPLLALLVAHPRQLPDGALYVALVVDRLVHVAGTGLALRADHRRALVDAPERLLEVPGATDERGGELALVDVVAVVGRRQHLGLVDHVRTGGLQNLGLLRVADACLAHHRNRRLVDYLTERRRVGHPGDTATLADVGRHRLQVHHRDSTHILGDAGLLGVHHVHYDAAFLHLREPALH